LLALNPQKRHMTLVMRSCITMKERLVKKKIILLSTFALADNIPADHYIKVLLQNGHFQMHVLKTSLKQFLLALKSILVFSVWFCGVFWYCNGPGLLATI